MHNLRVPSWYATSYFPIKYFRTKIKEKKRDLLGVIYYALASLHNKLSKNKIKCFSFFGKKSIPILFAPKIAWISHFVVNHTNEMKLGLGGDMGIDLGCTHKY